MDTIVFLKKTCMTQIWVNEQSSSKWAYFLFYVRAKYEIYNGVWSILLVLPKPEWVHNYYRSMQFLLHPMISSSQVEFFISLKKSLMPITYIVENPKWSFVYPAIWSYNLVSATTPYNCSMFWQFIYCMILFCHHLWC